MEIEKLASVGIDATKNFLVVQDGCMKKMGLLDLIKGIESNVISVCDMIDKCINGIGDIVITNPNTTDKPPVMQDLTMLVPNRAVDVMFDKQQFLPFFYDENGDVFTKIKITGGNVVGLKLYGLQVVVGQIISLAEIANMSYNARDVDSQYEQVILFVGIDQKGVESN